LLYYKLVKLDEVKSKLNYFREIKEYINIFLSLEKKNATNSKKGFLMRDTWLISPEEVERVLYGECAPSLTSRQLEALNAVPLPTKEEQTEPYVLEFELEADSPPDPVEHEREIRLRLAEIRAWQAAQSPFRAA